MPAAMAIGLGIGQEADRPEQEALLDADFVHRRFRHAGLLHVAEPDFLAAIGGVRDGAALTIGPTVIGPELLVNGGFDTDAEGWVRAVAPAGDADPEWAPPGVLQVTTGQELNRFGRDVAVTEGKAYRFGGRPLQLHYNGGAAIIFGASNLANDPGNIAAPFAAGELRFGYAAAIASPMYLGTGTVGSTPRTEQWDDFTVREAVPVPGHSHLALSGRIAARTPGATSGTQVLFQADDAASLNNAPSEQNRLRLAWGGDRHLRLVVTRGNAEQANLDLGVLEVATAFVVRFSAAAQAFKASLDGGGIVRLESGLLPAIAAYRIGRSNTGEAWQGEVDRVTLFATPMQDAAMVDPARAFAIHGDSTGRGDGGTAGSRWWELLAAGYAPARPVHNAAVAGQGSAALGAALAADAGRHGWTAIVMDFPNADEDAASVIAAYKAALGPRAWARWLIVPPADDPTDADGAEASTLAAIRQALRDDPFFAGHSLDAAEQAAYLAALADAATRADGIHFSDTGQAVQAWYIRAWLDARGW